MNKLRRVFEATGKIPDDAARPIKRNKKTSPVVCNISPERALSKRLFFLAAGKVLYCARSKKNAVNFSQSSGKIDKFVSLMYCQCHSFILQLGDLVPTIFCRAVRVWSLTRISR